MFGRNPVRVSVPNDPGRTLSIQEIFHTIQGEGPHTGVPAVFIRTWGCNLTCHFCDTDFESKANPRVSLEAIVERVKELAGLNTALVVLTGGEPMRQNCGPLIRALNAASPSFSVQVETAGTLCPGWVPGLFDLDAADQDVNDRSRNTIVCSPKLPRVSDTLIRYVDAWKYIVSIDDSCPEDGLPITSTQYRQNTPPAPTRIFRPWEHPGLKPGFVRRGTNMRVYVQPREEYAHTPGFESVPNTMNTNANVKHAAHLCMKYGYRMSLQTHKIMKLP